MTQVYHG